MLKFLTTKGNFFWLFIAFWQKSTDSKKKIVFPNMIIHHFVHHCAFLPNFITFLVIYLFVFLIQIEFPLSPIIKRDRIQHNKYKKQYFFVFILFQVKDTILRSEEQSANSLGVIYNVNFIHNVSMSIWEMCRSRLVCWVSKDQIVVNSYRNWLVKNSPMNLSLSPLINR